MKHLRLLILGTMLATAQVAFSQPPPPSGGGGGGSTSAPVDGASGALLIAAAAYGYSQLRKKETSAEGEAK